MRTFLVFCFSVLIIAMPTATAQATTAFTYQGQLQKDEQPFTGTIASSEISFELFDGPDSSASSSIAGPINPHNDVQVTDGLFQVELDFGQGAFDGSERYLEIEVAGNTLSPRQKITGAPTAQHALEVADGSVGSIQIKSGAVGAAQADSSQVQLRITGTCPSGTTLAGINPDGTVICTVLPIGVGYLADNSKRVGTFTSIAIRDDGNPIISYWDAGNNDLKVYDCSNAACADGDTRRFGSNSQDGSDTSIAIRADGLPIISYLDWTSQDLKVFDCIDVACSAGSVRTLDNDGDVGWHTSIAIRDNGKPIISNYDATNGALKIYDCTDAACSAGSASTLDSKTSRGDVGEFTSIAIRDNGNPIISYYDATNGALKIYDCTDAACSAGNANTLDNGGSDGNVGKYTSIAVRDNGNPIISYYDVNFPALIIYDCSDAACLAGTYRILDANGVGKYTSIAIREDGNPIISYYDSRNGNLKAYDCTNAACSNGNARTLDSSGDVGQHTSIAIRNNGNPIISYHDATDSTNGELKVYSCGDPGCAQ